MVQQCKYYCFQNVYTDPKFKINGVLTQRLLFDQKNIKKEEERLIVLLPIGTCKATSTENSRNKTQFEESLGTWKLLPFKVLDNLIDIIPSIS